MSSSLKVRNTNELLVTASVVPMVVGIHDSCKVDFAAADGLLQNRRDPGTVMRNASP